MAKKIYQIRLLEIAGEEPELKDIIEFELEECTGNIFQVTRRMAC